jgi:hypothetical protein
MIKQPIFFVLMLLAFCPVFFMGSCTSENMVPACDTSNMSYSQNIAPIIKNNCYLCHSKGNTSINGGILLDSYTGLAGWVRPYYADSSWLVGNIRHDPPGLYPYVPMPYMKPKLDACSINQIAAWVNQGAKDN